MRFLWGLESPAPNRHWGCFSCFTCNQTLIAPERRHLTLKSPLIGSFSSHTLGKTGTWMSQRLVVHVVPVQTLQSAELCESGLQLCQDFYFVVFWEVASLALQSETKQKVIREETQIHNLHTHARTHAQRLKRSLSIYGVLISDALSLQTDLCLRGKLRAALIWRRCVRLTARVWP